MIVRTWCLAVALCLALPATAHADPFSIGAAVLGGIISVGGPALAISPVLVGQAAIGAGLVAGQLLLSRRSRPSGGGAPVSGQKTNPGAAKETIKTEEMGERIGIGRVRVGMVLAFGNNKHPNLYRLGLHLRGPIDGVETYYVNGREVFLRADGAVYSSPWGVLTEGVLSSNLYIKQKIGDGTETAWTELTDDFFGLWTSDHRVRGIFQTLLRAVSTGVASERYQKMFSAASFPQYEVELRASLLYDPRLDTTAGGSGDHRYDDPSTWEWSDNGILACLFVAMQYDRLTSADFDWATLRAEADKADALVATRTGTEPRSRVWGVIDASAERRGDTLAEVMESAGAEMVRVGDRLAFRLIEDSPAAEGSIATDDIYVVRGQSGPEAVERPNLCRVRYYAPEREYEMTEIDLSGIAWARVSDEITRRGEKIADIDLPFCPSASQAQRIARRLFAMQRAETGEVETDMSGMAQWGNHYADIEILPDVNARCKIAGPRCDDQSGHVTISYAVMPTLAAWNPATDEAAAPAVRPFIPDDNTLDTPLAPSQAFSVTYEDGAQETRLQYSAVAGATGYLAVFSAVQPGGSQGDWTAMTQGASEVTVSHVTPDLRGDDVDFRVQAYNDDGSSEASPVLSARPVGVLTTAAPNVSDLVVTVDSTSGDVLLEVTGLVTAPNIIRLKIEYEKQDDPSPTTLYDDAAARPGPFQAAANTGLLAITEVTITQTVHGGGTTVETITSFSGPS
ncbi:phage tail protein [Oceaniradius stylonematis]|uniref:phage tail protein n=1 Tax=Oceaniradius stylonematis TaxID=2184161 RepID=UPI0027401F35|nr:phage tail protein [Oceaniradius stylonematis]